MLRAVMQRRLIRAGFKVLAATNGAEGIEIARANLPDLILMDMTMPVMDGWTATRLLRADPVTRDIPILAFTAQPMSGAESPQAAGCNGQVSKPFEFPDVLATIGRLLNDRSLPVELRAEPGL